MAPLATDPRHLLVVLNPARRKALYTLMADITSHMQSQLNLPELASPTPSSSVRTGGAPLFYPSRHESDSSLTGEPNAPASSRPAPDLIRLRAAALSQFQSWRRSILSTLEEILRSPDTNQVLSQRRKRTERLSHGADPEQSLIDDRDASAVASLQAAYHPVPTRLATIPRRDREEVLSAVLLALLSAGHYAAESRVAAAHLTSALGLPLAVLDREEREIAELLVAGPGEGGMTADAEAEALARGERNAGAGRYWKVGLASVAGAAVIGVTGGLAAPVVAGAIGGLMGAVGLGGMASFLGIFWMNGALVGTLFGALGGRMTGEAVDRYAREVEDFQFIPLREESGSGASRDERGEGAARRLKVVIGVNGWLTSEEDVTKPWRSLGQESEVFALRYEMHSLIALGQSLEGLVSSYAWSMVKGEVLKRTVLATLGSALWPAYMLSVAAKLDNPFSLARNRSEKAGKILADALINKVQGERPVTLIGYSLGARVIFSCLRTLAERRAFGLVEDVVFIGAPIPSDRHHWQTMRSVVSGRMFNVYSENDYILGFLYRATSMQLGIAGLQEIRDIEGVVNLDLSEEVQGHLRYAGLIGSILVRCGFPDIKGTDGTIKKEEAEITLQDGALGRTGTLIQLDDLHINEKDQPLRTKSDDSPSRAFSEQTSVTCASPSRTSEERMRRATIARKQSEILQAAFDPLGEHTDSSREDANPRVAGGPSDPSKFVMESPNTKYSGTVRDFAMAKPAVARVERSPPPYAPSVSETATSDRSSVTRYQGDEDGEESDEEDSYGGIRMVDNEGDFAHIEPIPMED